MALIVDLLVVIAACWYLFATPYPPLGDKGFWAYSALLGVLVGAKLITPFYVKPVDAIAFAVPAFVSMMLIFRWDEWTINQRWGFWLAAGFSLFVALLGVGNIVANSLTADWAKQLSNRLRIALDLIGHPKFIYVPLILFAVFSFHRDSWLEAVLICLVTGATVWWSAGDFFVGGFQRLKATFFNKTFDGIAGHVVAFQDPGIILLRQEFEGDIKANELLYVNDRHGPKKLVVALDYVGRAEGVLVRSVEIKKLSAASHDLIGQAPFDQCAFHLEGQSIEGICAIEKISRDVQSNIVGLVAPDTTIERLYFEVVDNADLEEGRLVSSFVGNKKVTYQIVAGLTKEEIVQQKNTYGFVRGQAQQVGMWDAQAEKFAPCTWLPAINAPVYLEQRRTHKPRADSVGHFPASDFNTRIKSVAELVTHNTAILGILGIGKSMLAIELVERILADNIKVICLDLTDEYAEQLPEFVYDLSGDELYAELVGKTGAKGKKQVSKNVEEGGSKPTFTESLDAYVERFITEDLGRNLLIINPSQYEVWRQDSKPFKDEASMASLSPTEIAQLFTEAALKTCQKLGRVKKGAARVCLVYEEAHSLVPEWNTIVNEGDKAAVNGTARAILQGRKFGLGCLLVTQRTANVTKTILNQCNTIFGMRTFDETGKDFLSNYMGADYAEALSSLPERHAVFFGKASSCENPVLIRLNDQDAFRAAFRAEHPPPAPAEAKQTAAQSAPQAPRQAATNAGPGDFDDDIPF